MIDKKNSNLFFSSTEFFLLAVRIKRHHVSKMLMEILHFSFLYDVLVDIISALYVIETDIDV